jgi:hypothetical protein
VATGIDKKAPTQSKDPFIQDESNRAKGIRSKHVEKQAFDESKYEYDFSYKPMTDFSNPLKVHTVPDMIQCLEKGNNVEIEARVIGITDKDKFAYTKMNKKEFLEHAKKSDDTHIKKRLKEALKPKLKESSDGFVDDFATGSKVGQDFTPLLGGPFHKQLYLHDYQQMHSAAFYAYHHDPYGQAVVHITKDFTLGRGWRVDVSAETKETEQAATALWRAFEEANNLYDLMSNLAIELSTYGEIMLWWLPDNQTKIEYKVQPGQQVPTGLIPRVRLTDPSVIWEIVTYPEDITRVLYYQWVSPTQYQIYTGSDKGRPVPSTKFIYQQIPADQMIHHKVNCVSNEKRGRSDLFPVLGYLKRLRDSVNYSIISLQKAAAWSLDTTVDGDDSDIDAYIAQQETQGTIAPAGSEFVHTPAIKREYLSNIAGRSGNNTAFEWTLSMISAGTGIPMNYFGTHLSGGQTRASALIATEPVAKKFEMRQIAYQTILKKLAKKLFQTFGVEAEIEVTFPEVVVQDRTAKLTDLNTAEMSGWISKKRASEIAARELGIDDYEYEQEMATIAKETAPDATASNPLTTPGLENDDESPDQPTGVDGKDRRRARMGRGF